MTRLNVGRLLLWVVAVTVVAAQSAPGQDTPMFGEVAAPAQPSDLTFGNLFSEGWTGEHERWPTAGRAVRVPLFRTRQPFLFREVRFDYRFAADTDSGRADEHVLVGEVLAAVSRRFQYGVFPEYLWVREDDGRYRHAGFWSFGNRLQVIDTVDAAMNLAYRVRVPRGDAFDDGQTRFSLILAGFRDVGNRVGVQGHVEGDFVVGPGRAGAPRREMTYAAAVTKTVTEEDVFPAELTLFFETYGRTELDGRHAGRTGVSILPGARMMVVKDWFLAAGIEFPLVGPRPYDHTVHVSIRREF